MEQFTEMIVARTDQFCANKSRTGRDTNNKRSRNTMLIEANEKNWQRTGKKSTELHQPPQKSYIDEVVSYIYLWIQFEIREAQDELSLLCWWPSVDGTIKITYNVRTQSIIASVDGQIGVARFWFIPSYSLRSVCRRIISGSDAASFRELEFEDQLSNSIRWILFPFSDDFMPGWMVEDLEIFFLSQNGTHAKRIAAFFGEENWTKKLDVIFVCNFPLDKSFIRNAWKRGFRSRNSLGLVLLLSWSYSVIDK